MLHQVGSSLTDEIRIQQALIDDAQRAISRQNATNQLFDEQVEGLKQRIAKIEEARREYAARVERAKIELPSLQKGLERLLGRQRLEKHGNLAEKLAKALAEVERLKALQQGGAQ